MRRWNGWGDENTLYPLPSSAARYLATLIGEGQSLADATLDQALAACPASKLPAHSLVQTAPLERLCHARGQSTPDWVALRSGNVGVFPDGVSYPTDELQVRELLEYAHRCGVRLIPYGGGTSVVGHINPLAGEAPILTVDLSRQSKLLELDETSRLATFGAGVCGPELERQLNQLGYTLGHFPQSFELSTLGGWIATRSSGQQSYYYGRIEDLLAGVSLETPAGPLELPPLPASAAGPDLRQVVLGSEGRLGIITRAIVRVRPLPIHEAFYGLFFHTWEQGAEAVRQIAQERVAISMARLSNAQETETTLALSGKEQFVARAKRGLSLLGYGDERSLLIFGVTGRRGEAAMARHQALQIARAHGGLDTVTLYPARMIGEMWRKARFLTPYLRNTLWERGYVVDTLETALPWLHVMQAAPIIQKTLRDGLQSCDERVWVFAHLSHVYRDGASLYITFIFRRSANPDETLARWQMLKSAASQAVVSQRGTISHQHGVGTDHAHYLEAEKGPTGMAIIRAMAKSVDPQRIMNPGKLFE
jgi:alkyldihydroxyacetonephosphate synthase